MRIRGQDWELLCSSLEPEARLHATLIRVKKRIIELRGLREEVVNVPSIFRPMATEEVLRRRVSLSNA
jgi:hypothetical protein